MPISPGKHTRIGVVAAAVTGTEVVVGMLAHMLNYLFEIIISVCVTTTLHRSTRAARWRPSPSAVHICFFSSSNLCLSVSLSISVPLSLYLSLSLSLSLSISLYLSLSLSISLYLSLYLSLAVSICIYLPQSTSIFLYLPLSISIYLYLPLSTFIYLIYT